MKILGIAILIAAAGLTAAGCVTRPAHPVAKVQPGDTRLTCTQMNAEIASNNASIKHLAGEDADVETGNVIAYVVFPFGLDLSRKEQIEMRGFIDRNQHLDRLRKRKPCPA